MSLMKGVDDESFDSDLFTLTEAQLSANTNAHSLTASHATTMLTSLRGTLMRKLPRARSDRCDMALTKPIGNNLLETER